MRLPWFFVTELSFTPRPEDEGRSAYDAKSNRMLDTKARRLVLLGMTPTVLESICRRLGLETRMSVG